jgi:hypothetical protein
MRLGQFLFALFLNAAPLLVAQQAQPAAGAGPPQPPGTVSGKVVNSVTGQTVKKAVVTLRNANGQSSYVTGSDQEGKFRFDNIQPDKYVASAQAAGYSDTMRGTGKPITVAAQQEVLDAEVRIPPLGVIAGKVLDENGQPLAETTVSALRYVYAGTGKRLQVFGSAQTDDRGQYRIFDIQPGRYYLMAANHRRMAPMAAQGGRVHSTVPEEGYAPVYYPGLTDISEAPPQELKPGAEWTGADFKLRQYPAYHIRGRVTGSPARGGARNMIRAQTCGVDEIQGFFAAPVSQQADGRFDVSGAVPGTYCLSVTQPGSAGAAAKQMVTVKSADVDDVELTVPASFTVSGTVIIDGTPPAAMPQINIGLYAAGVPGARPGVMKSDGTFQIEGLYPGAYSLHLPQGPLYAKSILYGSQDVTNGVIPSLQPGNVFAITMGTDAGEIDGTVQPGSVESGAPVLVVALPEDAYAARQDMQRLAAASAGATFALANVPPGNYKVFAIETDDFSEVLDRDLMKLLEGRATPVTVHAALHEQISVTAIPMSEVVQARGKVK